jgi:hypothetical protein
MIGVKDAVKSAHDYLLDMRDLIGTPLEDLRLEEVELSEQENLWLVTLGFNVPMKEGLLNALGNPKPYRREYKLFKVDAETSHVKAMKIRQV